jgi:hypothetical protein
VTAGGVRVAGDTRLNGVSTLGNPASLQGATTFWGPVVFMEAVGVPASAVADGAVKRESIALLPEDPKQPCNLAPGLSTGLATGLSVDGTANCSAGLDVIGQGPEVRLDAGSSGSLFLRVLAGTGRVQSPGAWSFSSPPPGASEPTKVLSLDKKTTAHRPLVVDGDLRVDGDIKGLALSCRPSVNAAVYVTDSETGTAVRSVQVSCNADEVLVAGTYGWYRSSPRNVAPDPSCAARAHEHLNHVQQHCYYGGTHGFRCDFRRNKPDTTNPEVCFVASARCCNIP